METSFPQQEKRILKFWKENKIFEKSIKQRARDRGFVFYEGPPTANAKAGIHHMLSRAYKDIVCRYKTMAGYKVERKAGWDTHGLPVELEIEKKLGIKSKKDIEKFGISKFNKKCKDSVWQYKTDWEKLTERIGFWLDLEHPYITYESNYIETVWWLIKQIQKKGLLYQDYRVVPYCPRCGTSLSSHEVAQGYKKIKDTSIFVKLQIKSKTYNLKPKTYLLVWTTTPWTLPGNVAVAVNPRFTYAKVRVNNEYLILAKERIEDCDIKGKIVKEFKGKDLIGLEYQPLYKVQNTNIYKIIPGDFVSLEEGTGLVHIAPAFGEDDMTVGKKSNLPVLMTVNEEGRMLTSGYRWNKMFVKEADPLIIEDLQKRGLLFKEELYEHDYPFCWRCKTPLLYYAKKSWFIRMTKVKERLIRNNQKINWIPAHLKQGRFGEWLKELKDWTISRERYWGTPLPIWKCEKCGHQEVLGSKEDLLKQKFSTNKYFILRHGESICSKANILSYNQRGVNCPLTKKGREQIEKVAKKLKKEKIALIFSSDFLRTQQTAKIVAKELEIKPRYDKRLIEVNFGIFDGKTSKEYKKFWEEEKGERFTKRPPKGENYTDVKKRMYGFLKDIDKRYKNKNILIISHGFPIQVLESAVKGISREEFLKYKEKKDMDVGKYRKLDFKILPYEYNKKGELDFHRPYIDEVKFFCPKCGKKMERIPEVLDCWFDSGSMPFAQYHYPFQNRNLIEGGDQFPADYISEAIDQTRGWFYTLLAISTLLRFGSPYKNVISLGHVLDEKGEKMSKSKGNVVDPWYIIEKYGSDACRWYFYTINQPGDSKLFNEKDVDQALKKFVMTFWNVYVFYNTYAKHCGTKRETTRKNIRVNSRKFASTLLDRWILSRLNWLIEEITQKLDNYDITSAARSIESFVIDDLSLWYIRRSRKRFQKPRNEQELKEASETLDFILLTLSKLLAPFAPFIAENIYKHVSSRSSESRPGLDQISQDRVLTNSVHLCDWPKADKKLIDKDLEEKMKLVREIVAQALAQRAKAGIKVRQPLALLKIQNSKFKIQEDKELLDLIRDEVNVKEIVIEEASQDPVLTLQGQDRVLTKLSVKLDTKITLKLKEEGMIREVIRQIQEMRKKAGYKPRHRILIRYSGTQNLNKILGENKEFILKEITAQDFLQGDRPKMVFDIEREFEIDQQKLWLGIKKI